MAWGRNTYAQIGDGTTTQRPTAVAVSGLTGVIALAGGQVHSLALKNDGTVWSWGQNDRGELGDGTTNNRTTPIQVCATGQVSPCSSFLTGITAIAAAGGNLSGENIALRSDGTVWTWGVNDNGRLGDGTTTDRWTPVEVCAPLTVAPCGTFLSGITKIASFGGGEALKSDGTVWTWGPNGSQQLGDGTTTDRWTPVEVCAPGQVHPCGTFLTGITAVAAKSYTLEALKNDGTVWSWGDSTYGQLGNGTTTGTNVPIQVCAPGQVHPCGSFLTGITAISAEYWDGLAVKSDGTVWAWGMNTHGEVGDGTTTQRLVPVQVSTLTGITAIAGGGSGNSLSGFGLAVKSDGTVWSWGYNANGQLGDNTLTNRHAPVQAIGLSGITSVGAGEDHSLATPGVPPSCASIAKVQTGTYVSDWSFSSGNSTALILTLPTASTQGNMLVIDVAVGPPQQTETLPTGWNRAAEVYQAGTGDVEIWDYPNNPGGISSVTITVPSLTGWSGIMTEWSGVAYSPLDQTGGNSTTLTTLTTTTGATVEPGELAISVPSGNGSGTPTSSAGWTNIENDGVVDQEWYQITPSSGTVTQTITYTGSDMENVIATFRPAGYACQVLADGPAAYWRLGETSGTSAIDSSGNGHIGVYTGGYTQGQTPGPLSGGGDATAATLFDGSTGYVTNNDAALNGTFTAITVESWVKTNVAMPGYPRIVDDGYVGNGGTGTKNGYELEFTPGGGLYFDIGNGSAWYTAASNSTGYNDGKWHLFEGTFDGTTVKIYADGVMVGQGVSGFGTISAGGSPVNIARRSNGPGDPLQGTLGDVAIYSHALTASQIANHYVLGVGSGPLSWGSNSESQLGAGSSAVAKVQIGTLTGPNFTTSVSPTLSGASTAGNLLVATIQENTFANGCSAQGYTGPAGWILANKSFNGTSCLAAEIWYYPDNPGGITTATFSNNKAGSVDGTLSEWSGVAMSSPLDTSAVSNSGAVMTSATNISSTAVDSGELGITAFAGDTGVAGTVTFTPGSGWTNIGTDGSSCGACSGHVTSDYDIGVGSGSVSETETNATHVADWADTFALFKPSISYSTPQQVTSLSGIIAVAAGETHSLALDSGGNVWAWGSNTKGELGFSGNDSSTPTEVTGITGATAIGAGNEYSAALVGGNVWVWGWNQNGIFGNNTQTDSASPVEVCAAAGCGSGYLSNITSISVGNGEILAIKNDKTLWAWGTGYSDLLGNGSAGGSLLPVQVCADAAHAGNPCLSGLANVTSASVGNGSAVAIAGGTIVAWGDNTYGQVGDGTNTSRSSPVVVSGSLAGAVQVASWNRGQGAIIGPLPGTVWDWGNSSLGNGTSTGTSSNVPVHVCAVAGCGGGPLTAVNYLAHGFGNTAYTVQSDHTGRSWGDDTYSQLGVGDIGTYATVPKEVCNTGQTSPCSLYFTTFNTIAGGTSHAVGLTTSGTVYTWGLNDAGQLGLGTSSSVGSAATLSGVSDVIAVAGGADFSVGLTGGGNVYTVGGNESGQLGNNTSTTSATPVEVCATTGCNGSYLGNIVQIAAGNATVLALSSSGNVYAWGSSWAGQLGDGGAMSQSSLPEEVCAHNAVSGCGGSYLTGVTSIAAGLRHLSRCEWGPRVDLG